VNCALNTFHSGFVAVVGRPNVGKSTLLNALLGQKVAIVSSRPQTTRRKQLGILTVSEGQIVFVDTPGIMKPRQALDKHMVDVASSVFGDADIVLWVTDASELPTAADEHIGELVARAQPSIPVLILNKCDRLKPEQADARIAAYRALAPTAKGLLVSAVRGDNLNEIVPLLLSLLPEGPQYYAEDEVTDFTLRDMAAELVREAALVELHDEVPHGVAVVIDDFVESPDRPAHVTAILYVERESHKGIVIGKGGEMLKRIGIRARREFERQLGSQAYLELHVKVREGWRQDENALKRLGYGENDER